MTGVLQELAENIGKAKRIGPAGPDVPEGSRYIVLNISSTLADYISEELILIEGRMAKLFAKCDRQRTELANLRKKRKRIAANAVACYEERVGRAEKIEKQLVTYKQDIKSLSEDNEKLRGDLRDILVDLV